MRRYLFGEWVNSEQPLSADEIKLLCAKARERQSEMRAYPLDKTFRLFKKLQEKWGNPNYPGRRRLFEALPAATGFSPEMIELALKEIVWTLEPELLEKKLRRELNGVMPGQAKFESETKTLLSWQPLGTVLHVLSGNVFLVAIGSLVEGLITGNVNILKMSSGEKLFLPVFMDSLLECDTDGVIAKSIAIIDYPSSNTAVIDELKAQVDGLVVWGGEEAVRAYRNGLPARTKCIVFGPKLSVGIATSEGLEKLGFDSAAKLIADEVAIWDQNACTAPQMIFVEGEDKARQLAVSLAKALEAKSETLPAGPAELNTAVEIQKMRGTLEIAEARGLALVLGSKANVDWTVLVDKNQKIEASPLHRTIRLVSYKEVAEITKSLEELRGYIQTVGLVATERESVRLAQTVCDAGALRVVEAGQMAGGEIDDPHDGAYDLSQYGHFVFARMPLKKGFHPLDLADEKNKHALIDARLRKLTDHARKSPFYSQRLEGIEINSTADLTQIAPLTREEMEANLPPAVAEDKGLGTLTKYSGGYVSRSGGSTGKPKFSLYDQNDWEAMISEAVRVLQAAGLEKGDRVANCMLSGDLYGSFVSFDHINSRLGATTFAFAGHVDPEVFLDVWRKFHINVVQAMPTVLIPLLKVAKQMEPTFTLEKVIYAGTPLSPSDRTWLQENLGTKIIRSIIGANDGGQLAFQCEKQSGAFHHLVDDFNFVEILDDKNQPVPEGEAGKIVITSLLKFAYPLIRYEIGDSAKLVKKCECGRNNRVIEYLGRSDDALCIGLLNLPYRHVWEAIQDLPISVMQLVGKNDAEGESILLRCETTTKDPKLAETIRNRVLERCPVVKSNLDKHTVARLEVELYENGGLPRNPRTGKVKGMVDERI